MSVLRLSDSEGLLEKLRRTVDNAESVEELQCLLLRVGDLATAKAYIRTQLSALSAADEGTAKQNAVASLFLGTAAVHQILPESVMAYVFSFLRHSEFKKLPCVCSDFRRILFGNIQLFNGANGSQQYTVHWKECAQSTTVRHFGASVDFCAQPPASGLTSLVSRFAFERLKHWTADSSAFNEYFISAEMESALRRKEPTALNAWRTGDIQQMGVEPAMDGRFSMAALRKGAPCIARLQCMGLPIASRMSQWPAAFPKLKDLAVSGLLLDACSHWLTPARFGNLMCLELSRIRLPKAFNAERVGEGEKLEFITDARVASGSGRFTPNPQLCALFNAVFQNVGAGLRVLTIAANCRAVARHCCLKIPATVEWLKLTQIPTNWSVDLCECQSMAALSIEGVAKSQLKVDCKLTDASIADTGRSAQSIYCLHFIDSLREIADDWFDGGRQRYHFHFADDNPLEELFSVLRSVASMGCIRSVLPPPMRACELCFGTPQPIVDLTQALELSRGLLLDASGRVVDAPNVDGFDCESSLAVAVATVSDLSSGWLERAEVLASEPLRYGSGDVFEAVMCWKNARESTELRRFHEIMEEYWDVIANGGIKWVTRLAVVRKYCY